MKSLDVKVGDKMVMTGNSSYREKIGIVKRITPSGMFEVTGMRGVLFSPYGLMRGCSIWNIVVAKPATEEDVERVKNGEIIDLVMYKMRTTNSITIEQAREIAKVLNIEIKGDDTK